MKSTPLDLIVALSEARWLLPLMAEFAERPGARFTELAHRLNCPRESLARTLELAGAGGWIARNPGYGHPLRPEYLLTADGVVVAQAALRLAGGLAAAELGSRQLSRWSLPVLHVLEAGRERFNEIARELTPASPRALSQSLKGLAANDLVLREVAPGYPPATRYLLTERSKTLAAL
jgi:DNA-binding HxlR family transcriptional regulator